jgi:hypothetical protein
MIDSIKINATLPTFQGNFEEPKIKVIPVDGKYKIMAIFELEANSEAEALEMAKDLFGIMGYQAEIKAA